MIFFQKKAFFVAYFTQQNEIDVELKLSIGLLHAGWRIQVPLLKRPRFLANRTCAKHKSRYPFIWQKFVLKKGYPRDHSEFLKSVIFGFFPVFTWPCANGLFLISRFWTGYWLHVNVVDDKAKRN